VLPDSVPAAVRALDVDRLFDRAASGEPRFAGERRAARAELVRRGAAVVPDLVSRLGTQVARDRHALKDLFRTIGAPAVEPLTAALASDDERTVRTAAWCLERMETTGAAPALIDVLRRHASWRVRAAAAQALARGAGREALPALIAALADTAGAVRKAAAYALGEHGARARRGRAADPAVREAARSVALAGEDGLARCVAALIAATGDPFHGARFAAARALGRFGGLATRAMLEAARGVVTAPGPSGAGRDDRTVRRPDPVLLVMALGAGDDPLTPAVLEELAASPSAEGFAALRALLERQEYERARRAIGVRDARRQPDTAETGDLAARRAAARALLIGSVRRTLE
jgi:HEAT repeat protein